MKKYIQNKDIAWRSYENEAILVSPRESKIMVLNNTGSFVWKSLEEPRSVNDCAKMLIDSFDTDITTAKKDVEELINEFLKRNLITALE